MQSRSGPGPFLDDEAGLRFMNEKKNKIDEGRFSEKGHGLGTVTAEMVQRRAEEIAIVNGRSPDNVLASDRDEAYRELTGHERRVSESTLEEQLPEERRWDPVAESEGKEAPTIPPSDEQTFAEELVEEGIEDAEHDQMLRATKESLKREPPE